MAKVLTAEEEYAIECAIYNDDNEALYSCLPEGVEDANHEDIIKDLAKGQKYHIVPGSNLMLRQDGRLFNVKFIRSIKPMWTPLDYIINNNRHQVRYTDIFKQEGWRFDHRAISKNYKDNNWKISVTSGYKQRYKDYIADL